jgi:hypothetical protein
VTQNVDQLHYKAGSRNVTELHGTNSVRIFLFVIIVTGTGSTDTNYDQNLYFYLDSNVYDLQLLPAPVDLSENTSRAEPLYDSQVRSIGQRALQK